MRDFEDRASLESARLGFDPLFYRDYIETPPTGPVGIETLRSQPTDAGWFRTANASGGAAARNARTVANTLALVAIAAIVLYAILK